MPDGRANTHPGFQFIGHTTSVHKSSIQYHTAMYHCLTCGSVVGDQELHELWHKLFNELATKTRGL